MQPTDFDRQVRAYRDTVYSCVTINATTVAGTPLKLYVAKGSKEKTFKYAETKPVGKRQKDFLFSEASLQPYLRKAVDIEEVVDHPFFDLLRNVNGFNNQFDLKELTTVFLELTGNSYWYIPSAGLGAPSEIWVLYSQWMKVIPDPKEFVKGYVLERGMKTVKFEESEVVHFKYPSPHSEFYGMGPLMGAASSYELERDMTEYEKAMFRNMGRPDIALVSKTGLGKQEQRERLKTLWHSAYGGVKKAGKVALLQGDLEIKEFGFPPREMSYLAGRKKTKEQIANAFGVPMSMLTTDSVNLANAKAGNYQHAKNAILPRCRRFEEKLNEKLFCAFDNPVPQDVELRLKERESNLKTGYSSINEERQQEGQEEVAWGAVPLLPMNVVPLGTSVAPTEEEAFESLVKDVSREIAEKIGDNGGELQEQKWLDFIKRQSPYEKKFTIKLQELFSRQEREVLGNMKSAPKSVKKGWEEDWLFNEAAWVKIFGKEGRPFIGGSLATVGTSTMGDLATGIDFDIADPRVQKWLGAKVEKYSKDVNDTTLKSLKSTLREGVAAGESIPKLRKRVEHVFDVADRSRAIKIARTETASAANRGSLEAYRQSGVVAKKEWIAAMDERTRDSHRGVGTVKLDEKFTLGSGVQTDGPGQSGVASEDVLCRCTTGAIVKK